jgi:hypothetical protein
VVSLGWSPAWRNIAKITATLEPSPKFDPDRIYTLDFNLKPKSVPDFNSLPVQGAGSISG